MRVVIFMPNLYSLLLAVHFMLIWMEKQKYEY